MRNKVLLLIFLASYSLSSYAADQALTPCKTSLHEYESAVESKTLQKIPNALAVSVTVLPSFEPEWKIATSRSEKSALLTYVVFDRSFWHSSWVETGPKTKINDPSSSQAKPISSTVVISEKLYSLINSEWERSVKAAHPSDTMGLDGETYNFYVPSNLCASTWSPERTSRNGQLVEIVYALRGLVNKEKAATSSETEAQIIQMFKRIPVPSS